MSHIADLARKERADRGKKPEGKVRDFLKKLGEADASFDWERKYDARAARGRFPSQAGDFGWYSTARHGLIEVKEVAHDVRLPKKNFGKPGPTGTPMKFGVLKKRMMAGGEITILVYHTTTQLWRTPDLQFFLDRASAPSWDLSSFRTFDSVEAALYLRGLRLPT